MRRRGTQEPERRPAVRVAGPGPLDVLLHAGGRDGREPGLDAADRPGVPGDAVLRQPQAGRGPQGQSQARAAADAADGVGGDLPKAADHAARGGTQDLPLFTAECGSDAAQPGVGQRHHVHPVAARLLVPGGGDGLVQPVRVGVAIVEHLGGKLLRPRALQAALRDGRPEIFNSDQGSQFTSTAFTGRLVEAGVAISMDGRGRALDNDVRRAIVAEREVRGRVPARPTPTAGRRKHHWRGTSTSIATRRVHQALAYRTPAEVYREAV